MPSYLDLEPGENLIFTRRRHIINLVPFAFAEIVVLLIVSYVSGWAFVNSSHLPVYISAGTISLVLSIVGLLTLAIFGLSIMIFIQNRIILTDRHYIQIDQIGLFNRTVKKLHLDEIQDVRGTRKGVLATLLNFGEIEVETAGAQDNFIFKPLADPLNTAEEINECRQHYVKEAGHSKGV